MSKEQQAMQHLLALIQSDRYPIGSALPSERKLARKINSSRNTVRNAICKLEARGLLQVRSGSGCYLLAKEDRFEPWRAAVDGSSGKGLQHLFEVRYIIEPVIGADAAGKIDAERLSHLEACVVRLSRTIIAEESEGIVTGDMEFRNQIAAVTGNPLLIFLCNQFATTHRLCAGVFLRLSEAERDAAFADYVGVLNAMKIGDADRTARLLRQNIIRLCGFVYQYTDTAMPAVIVSAFES